MLAVIGALSLLAALGAGGWFLWKKDSVEHTIATDQAALDPFYTPPNPVPTDPGTLIRSEVMTNVNLTNATAHRVLYTSRNAANEPIAVGGMVFVPNSSPAPAKGRKVVAWAHPTLGQANQCAPSRSAMPLADTSGWLQQMLDRGWVVTATDYAGLGTPGPKTYLLGQQEAKDVVNSVRAARNLKETGAGKDWIVWGHSQGGHSSLWTAVLAQQIAPELNLLAVGAAAPAQQLKTIVDKQWNTDVGWVIGVEAVVSFQDHYSQFQITETLSDAGRSEIASLNTECVIVDAMRSALLSKFRGPFFREDLLQDPQWVMVAEQQTPPQPPKGMPLFLSEGTKDQVVIAGTNANLQNQWCQAGVNMAVQWLGGVGHMAVADASGPAFVEWADARFAGKPNDRNCMFPPAVAPIPEPVVNPEIQRQADDLLRKYPLPPL